MLFEKLCKYIDFIKVNYNYLESAERQELVDILDYYRDVVIYNKYERRKNG